MQEYSRFKKNISQDEKEDMISREEFPSDEKAHPRSIMLIRRTNGIPYPFFTTSVLNIINKLNGIDPITRLPFSPLIRQRAELYGKSLTEFPNYKIQTLDTKDLYLRWINTHKTGTIWTDEVARTKLEARCFLQVEDMTGIFQTFNGKGSLANRNSSIEFLEKTGRNWVIRHCSLKDTEYNKAYVLTYMLPIGKPTHVVIVHKIGEGFFYNINITRESSVGINFDYSRSYPTIVNLLEAEIPQLLNNTADSQIDDVDMPPISD